MGRSMQKSKVASGICDMVEPALRFVAHDLQVLTANRPGNKDYHPSVLDTRATNNPRSFLRNRALSARAAISRMMAA